MGAMDTPLDPSAGMLLQQSLKQTEEDLQSGRLSADVAVDSLAEMDAYYFSARQADGSRVTGLLVRTRVPPHPMFVVGPLVAVTGETYRILSERLPAPPIPTARPPVSPGGTAGEQIMSHKQQVARQAGEAARAAVEDSKAQGHQTQHMAGNPQISRQQVAQQTAKARAAARPLRVPPGSIAPEELAPDLPPPIRGRGSEKIPQG